MEMINKVIKTSDDHCVTNGEPSFLGVFGMVSHS